MRNGLFAPEVGISHTRRVDGCQAGADGLTEEVCEGCFAFVCSAGSLSDLVTTARFVSWCAAAGFATTACSVCKLLGLGAANTIRESCDGLADAQRTGLRGLVAKKG